MATTAVADEKTELAKVTQTQVKESSMVKVHLRHSDQFIGFSGSPGPFHSTRSGLFSPFSPGGWPAVAAAASTGLPLGSAAGLDSTSVSAVASAGWVPSGVSLIVWLGTKSISLSAATSAEDMAENWEQAEATSGWRRTRIGFVQLPSKGTVGATTSVQQQQRDGMDEGSGLATPSAFRERDAKPFYPRAFLKSEPTRMH